MVIRPLRLLTRHRGYAAVTLATMALAIGANLVVFSVVNALWLRPLGIPEPDRVVVLGRGFDSPNGSRYSEAGLALLRQTPSLELVAGQVVMSGPFSGLRPRLGLDGIGAVSAVGVTPEYFAVLGVRVTGRDLVLNDAVSNGPVPVVITDRFWRSALKGRPNILGSVLSGSPIDLRVVGIGPKAFTGASLGEQVDVWLPHRLLPRLAGFPSGQTAEAGVFLAIARMRPGVTPDVVRAEFAQGTRTPPEVARLRELFGGADLPLVRVGGGDVMMMTAATAAFVLVGGCATMMALALMHYEQRRRDLAVRTALGGTRRQLIAGLSAELLVLAVLGSLAVTGTAAGVVHAMPHFRLPGGIDLSRLDLSLDWRVGLVALAMCLVALGLGSILPVLRFTRARMALNLVSPAATPSPSSLRLRQGLLALHLAATAVVLCAAALFVQSARNALTLGPGFDPDRVVFATVHTRYAFLPGDDATVTARKTRDVATSVDIVSQIKAISGVEAVALGAAPINGDLEERMRRRVAVTVDGTRTDQVFGWLPVGDEYLTALGVPLRAGRAGGAREVVITPAFARQLAEGEAPIGAQVRFAGLTATVVGIADFAIGSIRLGRAPGALYFGSDVASSVRANGVLSLTIRVAGADATRRPIEQALAAAFPDAPNFSIVSGRELIEGDLGRERMTAWLFGGFGLVVLVLAAESIFGLVAYLIASRRREFGVRMALGASRGQIAGLAFEAGVVPAVIGAICGLAVSVALSQIIQAYLFNVDGTDPTTYVAVFAVLGACALAAWGVGVSKLRGLAPIESLRAD
jgi:putative ABC transport system permease protein